MFIGISPSGRKLLKPGMHSSGEDLVDYERLKTSVSPHPLDIVDGGFTREQMEAWEQRGPEDQSELEDPRVKLWDI